MGDGYSGLWINGQFVPGSDKSICVRSGNSVSIFGGTVDGSTIIAPGLGFRTVVDPEPINANHQIISRMNAVVRGDNNTVSGVNCRVYGNWNKVSGANASAIGSYNTVEGANAHAIGNHNHVVGANAHAKGRFNTARGANSRCKNEDVDLSKYGLKSSAAAISSSCAAASSSTSTSSSSREGPDHSVASVSSDSVLLHKKAKITQHHDDCGGGSKGEEATFLETELLKDVKTSKEDEQCVVCLDNKRQLAPKECGHFCLCFECTRKLIDAKDTVFSCPICKTVIKAKMNRIFT